MVERCTMWATDNASAARIIPRRRRRHGRDGDDRPNTIVITTIDRADRAGCALPLPERAISFETNQSSRTRPYIAEASDAGGDAARRPIDSPLRRRTRNGCFVWGGLNSPQHVGRANLCTPRRRWKRDAAVGAMTVGTSGRTLPPTLFEGAIRAALGRDVVGADELGDELCDSRDVERRENDEHAQGSHDHANAPRLRAKKRFVGMS